MSSDGAYSRYSATSGTSPYGSGASYGGGAGYGAGGYGGSAPAPGYGGAASYSSPTYGGGADAGYGNAQMGGGMGGSVPNDDRTKGGKKSLALQALNKNVLIWAGFFTASLFVYFLMSGGDFSFLMTYGAMARMFGFAILNLKTFKSQRSTGISAKTLQLYSLVFFFRLTSIIRHEGYLPYDKSGDWLYHLIEILALFFTSSALYGVTFPFKSTYQADCDKFGEVGVPPGCGGLYLGVPTLILAILLHPSLNEDWFSDVAWTYSMYLESVAVIPQLYMFQKQKNGVVEIMNAHFVAALGFGRVMEFTFWIYSYHELSTSSGSAMPGYLAIISQFLQLILMIDFFWYYITAVKNATPLVLPSHGGPSIV